MMVALERPFDPSSEDDAQLLARGDEESFAQFYRRHVGPLVGYLMRLTRDPEAAADLTAETFAAVLVDRARYRADRGTPRAWLYAIASHKLSDWRRSGYAEERARRRFGLRRPALSADDEHEFERLAAEVGVGELLEGLPPEQETALRARVINDRDYADIASTENVSEAAVRQRVSRALAGLRRRIGGGP